MHKKSRLSQIARKPVSAGVIVLALVSVSTQMVALAAVTGLSSAPHADVRSTMASAVVHTLQCGGSAALYPTACPAIVPQAKLEGETSKQRVVVPTGATQCPRRRTGRAADDVGLPLVAHCAHADREHARHR